METKKIVWIILTILILGPIVFVGSCFPVGLISANSIWNGNIYGLYFAIAIGLILAILVCYFVIKKILKSGNKKNASRTD